MTNRTSAVYDENETNYHDRSDWVPFVTKTRQDNNMTYCTYMVYVEKETKLLWLIEPCLVYDKRQTGQRRDQLHRSGLCQKWNWAIVTDRLGAVCDENQIGQQHERSYRCGLSQNWNLVVMTNKTKCPLWLKLDGTTTWSLVQVWCMPKTILNYCDQSDWVSTMMKTG